MAKYTYGAHSFSLPDDPSGELLFKYAFARDKLKETYTHENHAAVYAALAAQEAGIIIEPTFGVLTYQSSGNLMAWVSVKVLEWWNKAFEVPNA